VGRGRAWFPGRCGNKLRGLTRSPAVCYQVDGIVPSDQTGWSVLVKGRAVDVDDPDDVRRVARLPLRHWAVGHKFHWIRILPVEVTGRRIWNGTPATTAPGRGTTAEVDDGDRPDGP
jgi:hypothetical protein